MRIPARLLLRILLLLALVPPAMLRAQAVRKPAAAAPATYRISGKVVNGSSDLVLANAEISIYATVDFHLVQSMTAGEDGRFSFEDLHAGKYMLQGSRRGFITSSYDEHEGFNTAIAVGEGLAADNLILRLTPDGMIHGMVTDEAGEPVRQARITLYGQNSHDGRGTISQGATANTDDTGNYELPHLRAGTYFLAVAASPWYATHVSLLANNQDPNAAPAARSPLDVVYPTTYYADTNDSESATPIPIRGGDDLEINFSLHPVPSLHLFLHLPEPRPEGAGMPVLERPVFGLMEPQGEQMQFASPGVVEITGVAPGQYSLQIPEGGNRAGRSVALDASADAQIDATQGVPQAAVAGNVVLPARTGENQQLMIGLVQAGKQNFQPVAQDGSFQFTNLAPGSYEVLAQTSGRSLDVEQIKANNATVNGRSITVAGDQQATITVTFSEGSATVRGVAKLAGKPAAGAMIVLVPANPEISQTLFRRDQSDSDGTFSLLGVAAGSYTVVAIQDGWSLEWAQPEVIARFVPRGQPVTVPAEPGKMIKLAAAVEVQPKEPARASQ